MRKTKAFFNGKIIPLSEVSISVFDRGFLYGDGLFESLRTYNRRPFLLDQHIKRLYRGLKLTRIRPPMSAKQLKLAVLKTLATNNFKESYIKIIITRGTAIGHGLSQDKVKSKASLIILVEEQKDYAKQTFTKGWKAIISSIIRPEIPTSQIKSLCYLTNILAMMETKKRGANEALLLDERGNLSEGTISNIFVVKHGTIYTPSLDTALLPGITRNLVIKLAQQAAFQVTEKFLTPKELYTAEEAFVTFSGAGIVPLTKIWKKKIGRGQPGPVTNTLMRHYDAETKKL